MLYLGIDQHARQLTISLRDESGDVLQARQVSTRPEKVQAFFAKLTRDRAQDGEPFIAVLEVCGFNDWLIREGYLTLKEPVTEGVKKFSYEMVDWSRTKVWGEGGYYARCFINVKGREPLGIVEQSEYESLRDELISKLEAMNDHEGQPMGTHVHKPQDIYKQVNRVAPDLVIIFGDLRWRSVGSVGNPDIYTFENDTGPDDANHAQEGMYILTHPTLAGRGRMDDATLYDVTPTTLKLLGQSVPTDMRGKCLV